MSTVFTTPFNKLDIDLIANHNILTQELECPIDLLVPLNPVMCPKCNQLYCPDCVTLLKKCPLCNENDILFITTKNTIIEYEIANLKIKCQNYTKGCPVNLPINEIQFHEAECFFREFKCGKCDLMITYANKPHHILSKCKGRTIQCYYCLNEFNILNLIDHLTSCKDNYILCVYCGCIHNITEQCRFKLIVCSTCQIPDLIVNFELQEHNCIQSDDLMAISVYFSIIESKLETNFKISLNSLESKEAIFFEKVNYCISSYEESIDFYKVYLDNIKETIANKFKKLFNDKINKQRKNIKFIQKENEDIVNEMMLINQLDKEESLKFNFDYDILNKEFLALSEKKAFSLYSLNNILKSQHMGIQSSKSISQDNNQNSLKIDDFSVFNQSQIDSLSIPLVQSIIPESIIHKSVEEQAEETNKINNSRCKICNESSSILCTICKINICNKCSSKCFSDKCLNFFCNNCYNRNKHQIRSSNLDCKFSRCKECTKVGFCLMSSINCEKCSKRTCVDCYESKHKDHFKI